MSLNIRENCCYAVTCPTSMGVRITPENRMAVHNSNQFYLIEITRDILGYRDDKGEAVLDKILDTAANLPANLLQAQRDYFGAHTYERVDQPRDQFFHTNWTGHGDNTTANTYLA